MAFALQVSHNGRTNQVPFDRFARVGSAQECQVRIPDNAVPSQALMIVLDGANGFRAMVKADGLIINGQPVVKESAIPFGIGTPLQMGNVTLTMVTVAIASAPVVQAVQRHVLPGVMDSPVSQATSSKHGSLPAKADEASTLPLIMGIVACVLAISGILVWMFFGQNAVTAKTDDGKSLKTIPAMIEGLRKSDEKSEELPAWKCSHITREEVIDRLRGAYSLEARGRKSEAKQILRSIQGEMQKDIPTDDRGHFKLFDPVKETPKVTDGTADEKKSGTSNSIVSRWFKDKLQQDLYDFLARKCVELDAK